VPTLPYTFKVAEVIKVTDGDTAHLRVSVGFHAEIAVHIRLLGYDCPEMTRGSAFEKAEARRAQGLSAQFLSRADGTLWVRTEPDPDSFGRWLGDVWIEDVDGGKRHLGAELRAAKLASVWPTRWHDEFESSD